MGLAKFVAKDPYTPPATEDELREFIPQIHGVTNWTIDPDGEVTLEYDESEIDDPLIEEALDGMGFKLKHIFDEPNATEVDVTQALGD